MLSKAGCSLVFAPDEKEMYPEEDIRVFDFGNLDKVMEGAHRPGHFNGVGQIVSKLFDAVKPDAAYFGEKDFQQLAIIKKMVKDMGYAIRIVPCPIVREADGLAMSSRNMRLSPDQRREAVSISKTLFRAKELWSKTGVTDLKKWVVDELSRNPAFRVEYFDIVDDVALQSVNSKEEKCGKVGCIAVQVGAIRLIDNIRFE